MLRMGKNMFDFKLLLKKEFPLRKMRKCEQKGKFRNNTYIVLWRKRKHNAKDRRNVW